MVTINAAQAEAILNHAVPLETLHNNLHIKAVSIEVAAVRTILGIQHETDDLMEKLGGMAIRYNEHDHRVHFRRDTLEQITQGAFSAMGR